MLLEVSKCIVARLPKFEREIQHKFWQGTVPEPLILLANESGTNWSGASIVAYCAVWRSRERAATYLITKARGEKIDPAGDIYRGDLQVDENSMVLRMAATYGKVGIRFMPDVIFDAAKRNDVRFFIRLGKALQTTRRPPEVDWSRCDPLACFLVTNWCRGTDFHYLLPSLCLFTDQALADFCSVAFGRKAGNPSAAGIRQWRRRLGLEYAPGRKIRKVHGKGRRHSVRLRRTKIRPLSGPLHGRYDFLHSQRNV